MNHIKENFEESEGLTCLKMEFVTAGLDRTPTDPVTGKRLSRPQMEFAKSFQTTSDSVRAVVTT